MITNFTSTLCKHRNSYRKSMAYESYLGKLRNSYKSHPMEQNRHLHTGIHYFSLYKRKRKTKFIICTKRTISGNFKWRRQCLRAFRHVKPRRIVGLSKNQCINWMRAPLKIVLVRHLNQKTNVHCGATQYAYALRHLLQSVFSSLPSSQSLYPSQSFSTGRHVPETEQWNIF